MNIENHHEATGFVSYCAMKAKKRIEMPGWYWQNCPKIFYLYFYKGLNLM